MNAGISVVELAKELERQAASRKDYIAQQGALKAVVVQFGDKKDIALEGFNGGEQLLTEHAHRQLGSHLEIPSRYYDRMRAEQPALLATNIQTWLKANPSEKRMVRTLDGNVRAWLSPRYRPLDNLELASAILPTLRDNEAQIMSSAITETRMYVKALLPRLSDPLPEGLTYGQGHNALGQEGRLVAAIVISNSEVGSGSLRVEPSVFTTWCTNLAVMTQAAMRKYHVGRAWEEGEEDFSLYRDETRAADDKAFFMKVRDVIEMTFSDDMWHAAVAQVRDAAQDPIKHESLPEVVEITTKKLALPATLNDALLTELARGADMSRWGMSSALTALAGKTQDYEMATVLERAGGKVLGMDADAWKEIAA